MPIDAVQQRFEPDETLSDPLPADPMPGFIAWFDEARERRDQPNPNAFSLATVDRDGTPAARIVLCKQLDPSGYLVFHTNYRGRKGRALKANPVAAACFHWDHADRQVRVEGPVVRAPEEESDAYFATRPWDRRIGAWASDQSEPIASREELLERVRKAMREHGVDPGSPDNADIPRPPHWGGLRLIARRIEMWCAGPGRVHDRAAWTREVTISGHTFDASAWSVTRLQP